MKVSKASATKRDRCRKCGSYAAGGGLCECCAAAMARARSVIDRHRSERPGANFERQIREAQR